MPKLILTGFSVFSGVEKNPTEDIICALKDWTSTLSEDELKLALRGYDLSTSVLVCSVDSVQDFLLEQIVVMEGCSGDDVILVHLGVDSGSLSIKLESTAYNNMTFRVPDQDNFQPDMVSIKSDEKFDSLLTSSIDVNGLCEQLTSEKWDLQVSTDPGRYLCNYVYYNSLFISKERKVGTCRSIFIHVPEVRVVSLEDQILFVKQAIQAIIATPSPVL